MRTDDRQEDDGDEGERHIPRLGCAFDGVDQQLREYGDEDCDDRQAGDSALEGEDELVFVVVRLLLGGRGAAGLDVARSGGRLRGAV